MAEFKRVGPYVPLKARRPWGGGPLERLLMKLDMTGDCWLWTGRMNAGGYGSFSIGKKCMAASRAAWMVFRGKIPEGLIVCHKCDNRICCNPAHLFLGTHQDNMDDMMRKGRGNFCYGERSSAAILDNEKVVELRKLRREGATYKSLAKRYGMTTFAIAKAAKGETWAHIKEGLEHRES